MALSLARQAKLPLRPGGSSVCSWQQQLRCRSISTASSQQCCRSRIHSILLNSTHTRYHAYSCLGNTTAYQRMSSLATTAPTDNAPVLSRVEPTPALKDASTNKQSPNVLSKRPNRPVKQQNARSGSGRVSRPKGTDTAYNQWGYLRHVCDITELKEARKAFDYWKRRFKKTTALSPTSTQRNPESNTILQHDDADSMRQAWEQLDVAERRKSWSKLMLSCISSEPEKTATFLRATLDPLPPGYAINDVLGFIASTMVAGRKHALQQTMGSEALLDLYIHALEEIPAGHIPFRQRTFGLIAKSLQPSHTHEVYLSLQRTDRALHANTKLQFASKLSAQTATKPVAFEILQQLADEGYDLQLPQFSSVLTSLLHRKPLDDTTLPENTKFSTKESLEHFMERGFTPNTVTFTAFLDSLSHDVDCDEVIRLSLLFAESGVKLDARTWSTVFRTAKHSLSAENITKALDVAKVASVPYREVLNNALHAIFYFATMESRDPKHKLEAQGSLFKPMLRIYASKFDLEPLQRWLPDTLPLLLSNESEQPHVQEYDGPILGAVEGLFAGGTDKKKLKPTPTTIAVMIRAYIRSLKLSYELLSYYNFFKARLEESRGTNNFAAEMMTNQKGLIHDSFIFAMAHKRGMSRPALSVFGDMLKDYLNDHKSDDANAEGNAALRKPIHPHPSLITFNLLIGGLFHAGEVKLAEKVLQVLKEHGHTADQVTWNTMIRGYSSMQSVSRTVSTLQEMEASGLKPDVYTFRAFGKLKDQGRAFSVMEDIIQINQKKLADTMI